MSRIGKQPINIASGVKITLDGRNIKVEGPKGRLERTISDRVEVKMEADQLLVSPCDEKANALQGLTRSLLANIVDGVTTGFTKVLEINGVGYRAEKQGSTLNLSLGYSHPIEYTAPQGVTIEAPTQTEVVVKGCDKQKVGQVASEIRAFRPPEPYKGKGVRYADERVVRKEAKKA